MDNYIFKDGNLIFTKFNESVQFTENFDEQSICYRSNNTTEIDEGIF